MEPFILKFKSESSEKIIDFSIIKYSEVLNLSVLKDSLIPAVRFMDLGTTTFTKSQLEGSDTDRNEVDANFENLLDTSTQTRTREEQSDVDKNYLRKLKDLLDTTTVTEAVENTDRDK